MQSIPRLFTALCFLLVVLTAHGTAQDRFLALTGENDLFVSGGDRHYTSGVRLGWGFRAGKSGWALNWLGNLTPLTDDPAQREYEFALGQNIFTPEFISIPDPLPFDRPYAGWFYGELSVRAHNPGVEEALSVSVGVIGRAALGERTQRFVHQITNSIEPQGWDNQLLSEPALLLRYRRSWFHPLFNSLGGELQADLVPRAGISLGNVFIDGGLGANLRLGSHLPERDTGLRSPPGLSGNTQRFQVRGTRWLDWRIIAGGQVRLAGRNIFLDGNTFQDSLSVDRRPFQWDAELGVQWVIQPLGLPIMVNATHIWRAREFQEQVGRNRFGSVTFTIGF